MENLIQRRVQLHHVESELRLEHIRAAVLAQTLGQICAGQGNQSLSGEYNFLITVQNRYWRMISGDQLGPQNHGKVPVLSGDSGFFLSMPRFRRLLPACQGMSLSSTWILPDALVYDLFTYSPLVF